MTPLFEPKPRWPSKPPGRSGRRWKHGWSHTKLHRVWCEIHRRCNDPKRERYNRYGGRGIKVCDEWKTDFEPFCKWALSNGYREGLQIDRINNDGDYEPTNCRFVTRLQNCRNRPQFKRTEDASSAVLELLKKNPNFSEVSRLTGLSRQSVRRIATEHGIYQSISALGNARYNLGKRANEPHL
jgi:hypothetical protein